MSDQKGKIKASFAARYLPVLARFAGKKDIRYYLNGILIRRAPPEIGGVYVAATNGHVLAIVRDCDGTLEGVDEVIIKTTPQLVTACRPRRYGPPPKLLLDDQRVTVACDFDLIGSDHELYVMPGRAQIEATYPRIERVIPNFNRLQYGLVAAVNPAYLAMFDGLGDSKYKSVHFWHETARTGSTVVQLGHMPEFLGIVMPLHGEEDKELMERMRKFPCKADQTKEA